MNPVIWAEMQDTDTLASVDLLIPDLIEEADIIRRFSITRLENIEQIREASGLHGTEKVAAGISLLAAGTLQLIAPGNFYTAGKIQLAFQLSFSAIGGMIGGPWGAAVGFGVGTVVGTIVAAVWVYGVPIAMVATGLYLTVTGLIELV